MSINDQHYDDEFDVFFQSWDDQVREVEATLKRFRSNDGVPVTNLNQLADFDPKRREARYVRLAYDRFSAGLKPRSGDRPSA